MTSDSTPVFALEKEALKAEIETGLQVGVDHLEDKPMKRKPVEKYHNTRHLLKQYRKVAYAIQISESDMNVRMEMEHGTRLSTLEVNAELAGVDLSGSKLEGYEEDFEHDGFLYSMGDIIKEEQHFQEENLHTEVVTVTTASKNLEDILAELKPTIEFDDGISSGTLSLDHSTIKTEAAGYKSSSYTVTATKNYTGLDRNDSSYIDKTVEKNGRTLSLSNVTWSVESTALVGDELVPATYSAVATYSGSASSTVATGYITTAEYKGTVVSSGISSILYTVTYLGTKIEPTKAEPTFKGAVLVISIIGGTALLAALLFLGLTLRKNTTVYKATGKGNEYEKCGRLHLKAKNPELRIDRLKDIPEGVIAIEVDQAVAKKLFGQTIAIRCYDNTVEHTVGEVNGSYWFKVDIGSQEGESNYEEEP